MAALDDPAMPDTQFQWEGRNRITHPHYGRAGPGIERAGVVSPGWHATVAGQPRELHKDGSRPDVALRPGLHRTLRSRCSDYDGGWNCALPLAQLAGHCGLALGAGVARSRL